MRLRDGGFANSLKSDPDGGGHNTTDVAIRIQHRAGRSEPLERLLDGLITTLPPAVEVTIIEDGCEPPNPWRGYRGCLEELPREGHVCVLQDDTLVCRNFIPALDLIAAANPSTPVALFLSKVPRRTYNRAAFALGRSAYVDIHPQDLVHVVGVLWPVKRAAEFLAWVDANPRRLRGTAYQSDDATVTQWMRFSKVLFRCTVPSLVEHPDDVPSVVNAHRVRAGADGGRVAAFWIGDDDPLALNW